MLQEWQIGIVTRIIDETIHTKRFIIELPNTAVFDFKPGQFVTLDLPIHEKKNKRWRSYSIASAPDGSNTIELIIVLVEDGLGTNYLFQNVQVGDTLNLRGPAGTFILPESLQEDVYMISTGTGIAPFRSMLLHIAKHSIPTKRLYLINGTRTQKDLLYADEMKALEMTLPNFNYIPVLSQEQWHGEQGRVHAVYQKLACQNPDALFFICGWKNMVDEARQHLQEMGFDKKQVVFELYG